MQDELMAERVTRRNGSPSGVARQVVLGDRLVFSAAQERLDRRFAILPAESDSSRFVASLPQLRTKST